MQNNWLVVNGLFLALKINALEMQIYQIFNGKRFSYISVCLYIEYCKYLYSMRNTGSSGRSKSSKDKGSGKVATQNHTSNTVKSEGPPVKPIQVIPYPFCCLQKKKNLIHENYTKNLSDEKKKSCKNLAFKQCLQFAYGNIKDISLVWHFITMVMYIQVAWNCTSPIN